MKLSSKFWFLATKGTYLFILGEVQCESNLHREVPGTVMMEENTSLVQSELQELTTKPQSFMRREFADKRVEMGKRQCYGHSESL